MSRNTTNSDGRISPKLLTSAGQRVIFDDVLLYLPLHCSANRSNPPSRIDFISSGDATNSGPTTILDGVEVSFGISQQSEVFAWLSATMHHWAATVHDFTVQGLKALAIRGMMEDYPDADYAIGRLQGVMRNWEKDIIWELGNDERVKEFLSKYVGGYQRPSVVLWIVNVEVWKEVEAKVGWELEEEMEEVVVEEKGEDMEEAN